jgi:hypothetical protein
MGFFDNTPRTRWLLTLSAFGVACGQSPPPSPDVAASDAREDRSDPPTDADAPDVLALDAGTDAGVPDANVPDANSSDANVPDANLSDANESEASVPDATAADAGVGPYPAGPYGSMEGQTLENLQLQGYVNLEGTQLSSALPLVPTSMQALRATGRRYALVHTSAFY